MNDEFSQPVDDGSGVASSGFVACAVKELPDHMLVPAAQTAKAINPANEPPRRRLVKLLAKLLNLDPSDEAVEALVTPEAISVLTTKWWGAKGVHRTVSFIEKTVPELQQKILHYMNLWNARGNVNIVYALFGGTNWQEADVRISRGSGGYYSYLGTDTAHVQTSQQTMNLEAFVLKTPESEYNRVIPHETFHDCGGPHEHMRKALVERLNKAATIQYFSRTQGWSAQEVMQQVLTPLDEESLMGTPADQDSVMCYQIPAECTNDGQPIRGGNGINETDYAFAAKIYPGSVTPPPPPPPAGTRKVVFSVTGDNLVYTVQAS